jgi:hypothetical protein
MKFYCISAKFYDCGKLLACIANRECKSKPKNQYKQVRKMSAFKIWLVNADIASQLFDGINSGEFDADDVLYSYFDIADFEQQRVA